MDERSVDTGTQRSPIIVDVELHARFLDLPGVYRRPSLRRAVTEPFGCTCQCGSESGAGSGAGKFSGYAME
jgi:hypothetical protein